MPMPRGPLRCSKCCKTFERNGFSWRNGRNGRKYRNAWCKECMNSYSVNRRISNPVYAENRRKKIREIHAERRIAILWFLGEKCIKCGFSDSRALQVDHVNGGGVLERKTLGTSGVYNDVIRNPGRYQLLCANCNWIKVIERQEVNHDARIKYRPFPNVTRTLFGLEETRPLPN